MIDPLRCPGCRKPIDYSREEAVAARIRGRVHEYHRGCLPDRVEPEPSTVSGRLGSIFHEAPDG